MRVVIGHGKHPLNFLSTSPYLYFDELEYKDPNQVTHSEFWKCEPVEIGNDVWIGDGVFIKNGIKIGDGAVLGARAVITKDVPPYAIVEGCPAKIIKYRFSEEIINELLKLKWWELDDNIIKKIPYDNINSAIKFIKEVQGEK
jgi:acetyltransferase-like isoleucine patch superfamily enzyme